MVVSREWCKALLVGLLICFYHRESLNLYTPTHPLIIMSDEKCSHQDSVKWGTYVNKNGSYQKYKCRICGSTWIGEELTQVEATKRIETK